MDRLTKKDERGFYLYNCISPNIEDCASNAGCPDCYSAKVLQKLGEYEDKAERGTLFDLPCKVGDTVYCVYAVCVDEWEVVSIEIYEKDILLRLGHRGTDDYNAVWLKEKGIYLFFDRKKADARLKQIQEGATV